LVILILVIAGFFRLWQLNSIPPGLYPDEAMNGNNAIEAMKTSQYKLFYPENNGREGLFINLQALSFKIFGVHIWSLILVSALIGIFTVLGLYLLTKESFGSTTIALLSMFFLATSFWHVNFSRIGFRAIMVPFCLVWSFYFLLKLMSATENKQRVSFTSITYAILSGFFFGLGFHTYIAFRFAVIILIIPIIMICISFWKEYKKSGRLWATGFKKGFWQYDLWFWVIIIVALPIGLYFLHNPQDFIGRAGGVSIFAQGNPIKEFITGAVKTLGMFNFAGDYNWRHNFSGSPQLFWPVGILFLIGFVVSVKELMKSLKTKSGSWFVYSLLIVWFAVMLLPAVLTAEGLPHALRTIGVIPVCYIFAGLGAYGLYKFLYKFVGSKKINKSLLLIACLLFLVICACAQYDKYFIKWAKQPEVEDAFAKIYVDIGTHLNSLPPEISRYVIVNQAGVLVPIKQNNEIKNIPMPAQTVIFIQATLQQAQGKQETRYLLPEEINTIKTNKPMVIIPLQYDEEIFRKLKEKFPEGEIKSQENFWLFEL